MTESAPAVNSNEKAKAARAEAVNKGYTAAMKRLREIHVAEFNALRVEETKKLGFEWTPEPTPAEKALAEAKALLEAHPDIAADLVEAISEQTKAQTAALGKVNPEAPTE